MSISAMISRLENIADTVPYASSMAELRSLGSQAMGTSMAIKEAFYNHGIDTDSHSMLRLCEEYDYGDDIDTLKGNIQIVLHQIAGYYRSKLTQM